MKRRRPSPCRDCQQHAGCRHAGCEAHDAWKAEDLEILRQINEQKKAMQGLGEVREQKMRWLYGRGYGTGVGYKAM